MGFGQGLSGLKGASQKLDVIGNNIANSGTVGFKSSTVSFADVYASSRVGLGTQVAAVNQNFGVGNISNTGGLYDMAIDGDRGLFRVVDGSGQVMYTRNGEFTVNDEGYLVNPQGYFVTGYIGDSTTPERIRVPYGNVDPKATDSVTLQANFDANAKALPAGALERRGWIDLTNTVSGDTARYFYKELPTGELGLYDAEGKPADPGAGPFYSGDDPAGVVAVTPADPADPPGTPPTISATMPATASFKDIYYPTGKEKLGVLFEDAVAPADPTPHYYKIVDGEYKWFDEDGDPVAAPVGPIVSNGISISFTATGQPVDGAFPEDASFDPYSPDQVAFDPLVPGSFTHSLPMTVYDSLGNPHQLTQYFVKRESSSTGSVWNVYYRLDGHPIDNTVLDGTTEMRFDKSGRLSEPMEPFDITFSIKTGASPAEPLKMTIDYAGSTQFGGGFTPDYLQNGYATGEYSSLTFAADGSIVASYTNGETMSMGKVVLAHFNNLQGLKPVGGNAWIETADSGPAILGTPGSMGFSTIKAHALEESNVDMGTELVNLIITQRVYQANAQTISAQSEILQTLVNMR